VTPPSSTRKQPASRSPKPAPTDRETSPRRASRHPADQGPVRIQRAGPYHALVIGNNNDAVIRKINGGQHTISDIDSYTAVDAHGNIHSAATAHKDFPEKIGVKWNGSEWRVVYGFGGF
jgi:hypothetical protein